MLPFLIASCALLGLLFLLCAIASGRRRRFLGATANLVVGMVFLAAAVAAGLMGGSFLTYQRLTHEQRAADIQFQALGDRHYRATIADPRGSKRVVELRGDEWQVDARILKWHGLATVVGFDTVYRLERVGGRYRDLQAERTAERTVHALHEPDPVDAWEVLRRFAGWLPFVDARYGSAVYLPMADGAAYRVTVTPSGLAARPLNAPAQDAAGGWK